MAEIMAEGEGERSPAGGRRLFNESCQVNSEN